MHRLEKTPALPTYDTFLQVFTRDLSRKTCDYAVSMQAFQSFMRSAIPNKLGLRQRPFCAWIAGKTKRFQVKMIQPYIFAMPRPDLCQDGFVLGPSNLLEVSGNILRVVRPPASTIRAGLVVKGQEELLTEEFRRPLVVEDGDAFGDADFQVLDRHKDV